MNNTTANTIIAANAPSIVAENIAPNIKAIVVNNNPIMIANTKNAQQQHFFGPLLHFGASHE